MIIDLRIAVGHDNEKLYTTGTKDAVGFSFWVPLLDTFIVILAA